MGGAVQDESELDADRQAWRDWNRVEACISFGAQKWGFALLGLLASDYWLRPISTALSVLADGAILVIHFWLAKRRDQRMGEATANLTE